MRKLMVTMFVVSCLSGAAFAQEHYTEGPVWQIQYFRVKPGKFDTYLKFVRANFLPRFVEEKKQGVYLDFKVFLNSARRDEKDWDIAFAFLHASYGKALDYSATDEQKQQAIAEKLYKTKDEDKQRELLAPRLEWRELVSEQFIREVTLKP